MTDLTGVAAYPLALPDRVSGRKGAIIASSVDRLVLTCPTVQNHFYLVERRGWEGVNDSEYADIKLVEDLSTLTETAKQFPHAHLLDIGPADFVDTDTFVPLGIQKRYCAVQIARWNSFKRHRLFVRAAALLPRQRFIKFGHYADNGNLDEMALMRRTMDCILSTGANVKVLFADRITNAHLPKDAYAINRIINLARIGIVTSRVEGINRFKMECLAANIPVLVPADACWPLKKHINNATGRVFDPTPSSLAQAIEDILAATSLAPRTYVLEHTGKGRSVAKLEQALNALAKRDGFPESFQGLNWNGRNESMFWGANAVSWIRVAVGGR